GLRLLLEAAADLGVLRRLTEDELDGTGDVQAHVVRAPDGAHAASAQLVEEPVASGDDGALREVHGRHATESSRSGPRGCCNGTTGRLSASSHTRTKGGGALGGRPSRAVVRSAARKRLRRRMATPCG